MQRLRMLAWMGVLWVILQGCGSRPPVVLIVNSYHHGYAPSDAVSAGIQTVLDSAGIDHHLVYLDSKRHTDDARIQARADSILDLIRSMHPDLLIATDDNAVKYVVVPLVSQEKTPVVFCGVNWDASAYNLPHEQVTGMLEVLPVEETGRLLRRTNPRAERLIAVTEATGSSRKNSELLTPLYESMGLETTYRRTRTFDEWKSAFREANETADLIYLPTNGAIAGWDSTEARRWIEQTIRRPVFTHDDFMMPYCVIGLTKVPAEQGEWAARTALRIIGGVTPADIEITRNHRTELYLNPVLAEKVDFVLPVPFRGKAIRIP